MPSIKELEEQFNTYKEETDEKMEKLAELDETKELLKYHKHQDVDTVKLRIRDIIQGTRNIARTSISVDLSGAAATLICLHTEHPITLLKAYLLYTEASSADAGITVEIGKETDRNYYYTGATEVSKALWYSLNLTLLKTDVAAGDTITFYSPGGKVGTGEIMLIIDYQINAFN